MIILVKIALFEYGLVQNFTTVGDTGQLIFAFNNAIAKCALSNQCVIKIIVLEDAVSRLGLFGSSHCLLSILEHFFVFQHLLINHFYYGVF